MTEYQQLVHEFNIAVGSPKRSPQLRASLIREEAAETAAAIRERDPIATIDGLCDVLYVVYGAADTFDLVLTTPMSEQEISIPPMGWERMLANLSSFARTAAYAIDAIEQLNESLDYGRMKSRLEALADKCWITASQGLGIELRPFFLEVHRTNMLKTTGPIRADGKRLKPEGWQPPRIAEMYAELNNKMEDAIEWVPWAQVS